MKRIQIIHVALAACALVAAGCAHQVTFERPEAYRIAAKRQEASATGVIDSQTLANKVSIRAFMTGIAQDWQVEPGDMLKQVADIELPQMFARYEFANAYREPPPGPRWIVLELAIPSYQFDEFRAKVSVSASAYDRGRKPLLQKTYTAEGETQGGKMFWGGAFAMKSAIRQSSLDAYKKIFAQLRSDLEAALAK